MNCPSREMIQMYLDNETPAERKAEIERHLETCEQCRQVCTRGKGDVGTSDQENRPF